MNSSFVRDRRKIAGVLYVQFFFRRQLSKLEFQSINRSPRGYKPISVQGTDSNSTFSSTFNLLLTVNSNSTARERKDEF